MPDRKTDNPEKINQFVDDVRGVLAPQSTDK